MNTRKTTWALLLLTTAWLLPSTAIGDGFEKLSLREAARNLGIGTGAGYHNKPCRPMAAIDYNRMLQGRRNPGWVNWKRSQVARIVPTVTVTNPWFGEDGTPSCLGCQHSPTSMHASSPFGEPSLEPTLADESERDVNDEDEDVDSDSEEYGDGDDDDDGNDDGDDDRDGALGAGDDNQAQEDSLRDSKWGTDESSGSSSKGIEEIPTPKQPRDVRTIEEILEGIRRERDAAGTSADQAAYGREAARSQELRRNAVEDGSNARSLSNGGYEPGSELWNRLDPATRKLFRREFPRQQVPPQSGVQPYSQPQPSVAPPRLPSQPTPETSRFNAHQSWW